MLIGRYRKARDKIKVNFERNVEKYTEKAESCLENLSQQELESLNVIDYEMGIGSCIDSLALWDLSVTLEVVVEFESETDESFTQPKLSDLERAQQSVKIKEMLKKLKKY